MDSQEKQKYSRFLEETFSKQRDSNLNSELIYAFWTKQEKTLTLELGEALSQWVDNKLSKLSSWLKASPDAYKHLGKDLFDFGGLIQDFPGGQQAVNLELAIIAYHNALKIFTCEEFPTEWAETQRDLGNVYRKRIQGDQARNLEEAIIAHHNALKIFTREEFPADWAETQRYLGVAYRNRIRGDKTQNLEKAIIAHQNALTIYTQETFPIEWARTQDNLGVAYRNRIYGDQAQNLEKAITCYQNALTIRTREDFPTQWAMTQNNLGAAYRHRIQGDQAQNVEEAITCYQNALTIRTREDFPTQWANTQSNLGLAYENRIRGYPVLNLEEAIAFYQNALTIHTPETNPSPCLRAARDLGNLAFTQGNWELAIVSYHTAIAATEQLRMQALSDQRRQKILKDAVDIYANLIHAYVQTEEYGKALEIADRSRAKHLVDLMSSSDLYQDEQLPEQVQQLLQQYHQKQQELNQRRDGDSSHSNNEPAHHYLTVRQVRKFSKHNYQQRQQAIEQRLQQIHQIWLQIRQTDSVLAKQIQVDSLTLSQMQGLLSDKTALISFFTTPYHTHLFILRNNAPAEVFTCTGENRETFQHWLRDHWLLPYAEINESEEREAKFQHWKEQMPYFLAELSQRLQLNQLVTHHLQNINELIIIPHLYLHQIPFAALPLTDSYLGDQFTLRIAPSCQILDFCYQRQQENPQALGVIENATNDLLFSSYEVEQITQLYEKYSSQRLTGKQATLDNYEKLTQNVQILHSSHHAQVQLTQPLDSSLKLADGEIYLRDLLLPSWRRPELLEVFLSCCETQLGKVEMTDDLLSLSAGFLIAGARAVLSTLWQVEDLPTALLAIFYYQSRQKGISRAAALQQAQKRLREMSKEEFSVYGESMKRHLEAQAQPIKHQYEELVPTSRKEKHQERKKQLKAENRRLFREINRYETAIQQIEQQMRGGENKPFSHPYYWSSVVCQGL